MAGFFSFLRTFLRIAEEKLTRYILPIDNFEGLQKIKKTSE